jgi:hypothetical protein
VALRTCAVAVKDAQEVEHLVEVSAETLYEAIATALAALQKDVWVGEIGQGLTTVTVLMQQPPVKHEVKMRDFVSWLGRQGRPPRRSHAEAKAGENIGHGKPPEEVTEKGCINRSAETDLRSLTDLEFEPLSGSA